MVLTETQSFSFEDSIEFVVDDWVETWVCYERPAFWRCTLFSYNKVSNSIKTLRVRTGERVGSDWLRSREPSTSGDLDAISR